MARLSDRAIRDARATDKPRKLFDGEGLFLLLKPSGARLWRFKYRVGGKEKLLSFGSYPEVSLKLARERLREARGQLALQVDPSVKRRAEKVARADTFEAVGREWLELQKKSLSPATYAKSAWLLDLLYSDIGGRPIRLVSAADLLVPLRRIEARERHETAHRAKQKAGQVFRYAIATGRGDRDPSQDLRGALAPVVTRGRAALTDPARVGGLLRALDGYRGQPSTEFALKLAPLVFSRPAELRWARWEEFSLEGRDPLWRIPGERMKMGEEHVVPLATQAVELLRQLKPHTGPQGLLFPGLVSGAKPISENTINGALRRLGYGSEEMTAHGFRAMASTLLNELGHPPDIIELQLAHRERDKVRAAYNRATRLPERRKMMQSWADYLDELRRTR